MNKIFAKESLDKDDVVALLNAGENETKALFAKSAQVKEQNVGNKVYLRGLIEFSNICAKNCYYCGIRSGNSTVERYNLSDEEILQAAKFAYENRFASIVLQAGEVTTPVFTKRIKSLLQNIKALSGGALGVTLSLGEQSSKTYKEWFDAGAHRYLLRIESSNKVLYQKIHPNNHDFDKRMACLHALRSNGYQLGTGVMIGLPFQTVEDLADDLLFFREFSVDMVGMGPYIEHPDTPMFEYRNHILPKSERLNLALKMMAILRIMMPNINIAAATALQAIDPLGREKAIKIGANVLMPNITPGKFRNKYKLYENKPCTDEDADDCTQCLDARIQLTGNTIGYNEWGDSKHFSTKR